MQRLYHFYFLACMMILNGAFLVLCEVAVYVNIDISLVTNYGNVFVITLTILTLTMCIDELSLCKDKMLPSECSRMSFINMILLMFVPPVTVYFSFSAYLIGGRTNLGIIIAVLGIVVLVALHFLKSFESEKIIF